MMEAKSFVFRFADVEVWEREFSVVRAGESLPLEPKAFRVLIYMLRNPGKLISKEELLDAVWKDTAVSENSLTRVVAVLRRALGDEIREPRFIATVATVGYRFVCPVEVIGDSGSNSDVETPQTSSIGEATPAPTTPQSAAPAPVASHERRSLKKLTIPAAIAVIAVLAAGLWYLHLPLPAPRITDYAPLTIDGRKKSPVGSDGNRLFMSLGDPPYEIGAQVPISGGQIAQIPIELPCGALADLSPDGSNLLVYSCGDDKRMGGLLVVGAEGRPARYLIGGPFTGAFTDLFTDSGASWSPDGKSVLYSTSHGDIYEIPSGGGEPRLLLASPAPAGKHLITTNPQLSRDERIVRFDRDHAIWEMSSSGGNLHKFLPDWHPSLFKCCGRWTPDGEFFIFHSGTTPLEGPYFVPGAQLWAVDERHGRLQSPIAQPIQLTSGPTIWGAPVLSRDGQKIFAQGLTLRGEVVRYDKQSRELAPYLGGLSAEFFSFSTDGKSVAYVSFPEGILWRANRDGSGSMQLTKPPFHPKVIRWSPDGTQIIFTDDSPASVETIYLVSSHGGTPVRLLPEDNGSEQDANWSPDGKSVVYTSAAQFSSGPHGNADIRILDLASHTVTTLPGSAGNWSPRWSPDGRYIAAITVDNDLAVFDLETRHWTTIRKGKVDWPTFSHDSRFIYFLGLFDRAVFRIPVSGGPADRVVDLKDFRHTGWVSYWMGLDPDDTPLLLRDRGTDEIYALTLERK
jgi:Tol biopolymer transport system component/DNA-binding winged helix-turn-helix (wHTH) protein